MIHALVERTSGRDGVACDRYWFRMGEFVRGPEVEVFGRAGDHAKAHAHSTATTARVAVSVQLAGRLYFQVEALRLAGREIDRLVHSRDPKAMDDIGRLQLELNRSVARQVQRVSGLDSQGRVVELPPPFVRDHFDRQNVRSAKNVQSREK